MNVLVGSKKKLVALMACMVVISCSLCFAKESLVDNMSIVREKMQADMKLLVAENMELTKAEAKSFWPVYEEYQNELFLLHLRNVKLINDFAESYQKMTDKDAKKLLDEYLTIEHLYLKLLQDYLPKFRNALPEKKVIRFYQIENKVHALVNYELAKNIPLVHGMNKERKSGL